MITLNNINLSSIDLSGIDLRGVKLGVGGRGGGSGDGFPQLPGDVTRWHFGGLTNEMMAAMDDPRIEDADHKGRFLSFKNFAWKGMSGVGGYVGDFSKWVNNRDTTEIGITKSNSKVIIDVKVSQGSGKNIVFISKSNLGISNNVTIKITSTYPEGVMKFANSASNKYLKLPSNGIITLQDNPEYTSNEMHLHLASADLGQITIEQLPLYPGALVFDGVDDYGTCDNFPILTKEKGYTVVALRQWISMGEGVSGLVSNVKNWFNDGAFILEYNSNNATNKFVNRPVSFGNVNIEMDLPNNFTYQTSKSYKGVPITIGSFKGTNSLFVGKLNNIVGNYSNVAIWELVFLDHDATEEELTKIKDYFVKTYPWLFFDQAWTVVGKTNEDEDRATIANITGNGNDLVLSNFGFAEGSGYGLYKTPFELYPSVQHSSKYSLSFSKFALGDHNLIIAPKQNDLSYDIKVKVTGLKDGVKFKWGWIGTTGYIDITTDGIHMLNKPASQIRQLIVEFAEDFDPDHVVTIEQIPEYEGYLITDGVDDTGRAVGLTISKDFTLVGEWILFSKTSVNAGLSIHPQIHIFNRPEAIQIMFRTAGKTLPVKSLKAICSDGRCYDENWSELKINVGEFTDNKGTLFVASNGTNYAQIAFKNLGIYDNQILSKDDCIKAYNYLQSLKAK